MTKSHKHQSPVRCVMFTPKPTAMPPPPPPAWRSVRQKHPANPPWPRPGPGDRVRRIRPARGVFPRGEGATLITKETCLPDLFPAPLNLPGSWGATVCWAAADSVCACFYRVCVCFPLQWSGSPASPVSECWWWWWWWCSSAVGVRAYRHPGPPGPTQEAA